ncbi:MAG: rhomboid family intramembrane serine protease [Chitinophagales bacterium]
MLSIIIVLITCLTSYMAFNDERLRQKLLFSPYAIKRTGEYYRFISSGFIHGDWIHLLFNMYVLYEFGNVVENAYTAYFGSMANLYFLALYFGGMIIAQIYSYYKHQDNSYYAALGASGAVASIVFSFIAFAPLAPLTFVFFPFIQFPAIVLGLLYLAYSYYASINANDNIGHDAHFYGAVFGFLFTISLEPQIAVGFFRQLLSIGS